jgi:uncharacterized protein YPO0396
MSVRAIDIEQLGNGITTGMMNFANHITAAMVEMQRVNVDTKLALDRLNETLKDMMGTQEAILQEMKKNE